MTSWCAQTRGIACFKNVVMWWNQISLTMPLTILKHILINKVLLLFY